MPWESWSAAVWAAQIVSLLATLCNVFSFQLKDSRKLLILQGIIGASLWALHYGLLGAWSSCLIEVVTLARGVFIDRHYKKPMSVWVLVGLCGAMVAAGTVGLLGDWGGGSLLPWVPLWLGRTVMIVLIAVMVLSTIALWTGHGVIIRLNQLCFTSPAWLVNNLFVGSIFGVITEVADIVSVCVSLFRFGLRNGKKE